MDVKAGIKRRFSGVSWQHPVAQRAMPLIDGADRLVRIRRDLGHLPAYSIRIRGNGVSDEFGGRKFVRTGDYLTGSLVKYAGLTPKSRVLEIGSGAGRIPYSLKGILLSSGCYTGLDVDSVSVHACQASQTLTSAGFTFVHADLHSDLYNDGGSGNAATYSLPFDDGTFDVVYLESVFTHLTGEECANYAKEILRVLKAGGRAVVSGFLRDLGTGDSPFTFQHQVGEVYVEYSDNPRKAVAADTETFGTWFGHPHSQRLRGSWRGDAGEYPNGQDWLIFTK
ncbi:MAG TPA: class I SAM-dependent methyltransferase [Dermatophilaceae bacterium]